MGTILLVFAALTTIVLSSSVSLYPAQVHAERTYDKQTLVDIVSRQRFCRFCPRTCLPRGRARRFCRRACSRGCRLVEDRRCPVFRRRFGCIRDSIPPTAQPPVASTTTTVVTTRTTTQTTTAATTSTPVTTTMSATAAPFCSFSMTGTAGEPGVRGVCSCGRARARVILLQQVPPAPPTASCLDNCYTALLSAICNEDDFAEFVSAGNMFVDQCCERCMGVVNRISRQCI